MNITYRIVHGLTRLYFKLYGRWEIIGHEKIPKTGAVIVAPNHVSYLDPPIVGSAVERECRFMARYQLWNNRFLAWILPRLGSFPVHQERLDMTAIKLSLAALKEELVLVIFPEGTRSYDGALRKGELGTALLVQKSGAPVVPTAVIGPEIMLPRGSKKLKRVRLKCVFGDPITFPADASRDEIVVRIMREIAQLMTQHGKPMTAFEDRAPDEIASLDEITAAGRAAEIAANPNSEAAH